LSETETGRAAQRAFLNSYYGISRHFYDLTRKYYLFGRDQLLDELLAEPWTRLLEVGVGTGRNLRQLHRRRPQARLGGIDASDQMVSHAQKRCSFAAIQFGFAEDLQSANPLDAPPERIMFSYSLSMMSSPLAALASARAALAPGGSVAVVDFGDLAGLPAPVREPFRKFLATFHVKPLEPTVLREATSVNVGPLGYFVIARYSAVH